MKLFRINKRKKQEIMKNIKVPLGKNKYKERFKLPYFKDDLDNVLNYYLRKLSQEGGRPKEGGLTFAKNQRYKKELAEIKKIRDIIESNKLKDDLFFKDPGIGFDIEKL